MSADGVRYRLAIRPGDGERSELRLQLPGTARPSPARQRLSPEEHRRLARQRRMRRELTGWAFLAPMFVFFVAFLLVPVILVFWWSTQEGRPHHRLGVRRSRQLPPAAAPGRCPIAIRNTFRFALLSIPITLLIALGVAMLLARVGRGGSVYRFLVYFPALVPGVVAGLIWIFLTNVDFGLFNTLLRVGRARSGDLARRRSPRCRCWPRSTSGAASASGRSSSSRRSSGCRASCTRRPSSTAPTAGSGSAA